MCVVNSDRMIDKNYVIPIRDTIKINALGKVLRIVEFSQSSLTKKNPI